MNSIETLESILKIVNNSPFNSKKIYFNFTEIVENDNGITLEVKFGASEKRSLIFKQYLKSNINIEKEKEILFYKVIQTIFEYVYNRFDTDTFLDNGLSEIIRTNN